jgi:hypothetical protein
VKIEAAKICLDCDEIYEGRWMCPKCASRHFAWLFHWLEPGQALRLNYNKSQEEEKECG